MRHQLTTEGTSGSPIPVHWQANGAAQGIVTWSLRELKTCYLSQHQLSTLKLEEKVREKERISQADLGEIAYRNASFDLEKLVFINTGA